jgi:hypothetical protein
MPSRHTRYCIAELAPRVSAFMQHSIPPLSAPPVE